jgi:UDP-2-acetamido-2-deoxy-ribo-hexuluronate aminotransferase
LRDQVAQQYSNLLSSCSDVISPFIPSGARSVWAQYSVLAKNGNHRALLQKKLQDNKIPTAIYYPKPLHLQIAFSSLGYKKGDFRVSEDIAELIFSLPMHPYLTERDQQYITLVMVDH